MIPTATPSAPSTAKFDLFIILSLGLAPAFSRRYNNIQIFLSNRIFFVCILMCGNHGGPETV